MNIYAHPDWLAFVAGIIEHPDANLPRLVAADWLTEQGEEERAEFIRIQCEVAAPCDPWCRVGAVQESITQVIHGHLAAVGQRDVPCPKCGPMRARQSELLRRHRAEWFPGLHTSLTLFSHDLSCVVIRRGFPAVIRASLSWVRGGACEFCSGVGHFQGAGSYSECQRCLGPTGKGTGHTPAHGYDVIRSQPITRVVVTSAEPQFQQNRGDRSTTGRSYTWSFTNATWLADNLPRHLKQWFPKIVPEVIGRWTADGIFIEFWELENAIDALSAAIIADARSTPNQQETR